MHLKFPSSRKILTLINTLRNGSSQVQGQPALGQGQESRNKSETVGKIGTLQGSSIVSNSRQYIRLALASAGVLLLVISYLLSSMILTFMGLGLVLWAILLLYITQSRYVHENSLVAAPLSLIKTIDSIVVGMGYGGGKAIFFYPRSLKGLELGSLFISVDDKLGIPTDEQMTKELTVHEDPKGLAMSAPSSSLVELFESRLNTKFSKGDLSSLQEYIPSLLTEELRIVDDISLERKDDRTLILKMVGGPAVELCKMVSSQTRMGDTLGCPLCGAFALVFSKISGKPVIIKYTGINQNSIETVYEQLDVIDTNKNDS